MAQTTDGFLWLGTTTGLYRFDGVHFDNLQLRPDQSLQKNRIYRLLAVPDGGLWISYFLGGLSFLKNGSLTHYIAGRGFPTSPAQQLVRDDTGSIWALLSDGSLIRLENGRWSAVDSTWGSPGPATYLLVDHSGTLWVTTSQAIFFLPIGERKFRRFKVIRPGLVAEGHNGEVLIASPSSGTAKGGRIGKGGADSLSPSLVIVVARRDKQGMFWRYGSGLLYTTSVEELIKDEVSHGATTSPKPLQIKDGMSGNNPDALVLDREGNIWVATEGGIDQFRHTAIVPVALPLESSLFSLSSRAGGGIWATAQRGESLFEITNGQVSSRTQEPWPISLYRDEHDVVWIGTRAPGKILRVSGGHNVQIPIQADMVGTITSDSNGKLWALVSGKGFLRFDAGHWTNLSTLGAPEHGGISSFSDSKGHVWFGFQRDRVVMLENERVSILSVDNGVQVGDVSTIRGLNGSLWIAGEKGLEHFDGSRFQPLLPVDRATFSNITGVVPTNDDGLWFGESQGIIHIPESELRRYLQNPSYRVAYRKLDRLDGLPAPLQQPSSSPVAIQSTDGTIWFATQSGLVWIDRDHIPLNLLPPPVSVLQLLTANNERIVWPSQEFIRLPAGTKDLQITYTALSFSVPSRVRFRYRLEGQDSEWQNAGLRREALYTNLGPGKYHFQVVACNNDGLWNDTGASLDFAIAPAYYQTWWFKLGYMLAFLLSLWLFYLYRLNRATAQIRQRLGAQMEERERIARELHDTLLQGFHGLMLRLQAVMKVLPSDGHAREMMGKVLDRADEVLLEGRESVRDLREGGALAGELPDMLAKAGEEWAQSTSIPFGLVVIGDSRSLNPVVFTESYRIAGEALSNAFQHSRATKVELELSYHITGFTLRVRDNGSGIDSEILGFGKKGHWGMSGMRERARKLGGQLNIWSKVGAGTEIELVVPQSVAFPRDDQRSIWKRSFRARTKEEE